MRARIEHWIPGGIPSPERLNRDRPARANEPFDATKDSVVPRVVGERGALTKAAADLYSEIRDDCRVGSEMQGREAIDRSRCVGALGLQYRQLRANLEAI